MTRLMTALLILVLTGCGSTGTPGVRKDQSIIDRDEIEQANQMNAFELVQNARPHWLRRRGTQSISSDPDIIIYVDGIRAGDSPRTLSEIPAINIEEIRYYDAREAQFRFGVGHLHGAINVITRRG